MATHSSILAWKIPWTEKPGRLSPWDRKESDMTERLNFLSKLTIVCLFYYSLPNGCEVIRSEPVPQEEDSERKGDYMGRDPA